jgi:CubicO group peptidase (beta-lactamase class C family)
MITCTAIGILVGENRLAWGDPIRNHLPTFDPLGDPSIGEEATIIDVCRHSTGLGDASAILAGPGGTIFNKAEDHISLVNALPTANDSGQRFQKDWWYSNAAFGLLAQIVEKVSGMPFPEFLQKRIFQPLRMSHTNVMESVPEANANIAFPYVRLSDGSWSKIATSVASQAHGPVLASIAMRSSVNDMLAFMAAVMNQYDEERGLDTLQPLVNTRSTNPLQQIGPMWNYWWTRPVDDGFENNSAYTLGWYRTTMPTAALGICSYNRSGDLQRTYLHASNILGKDSTKRTLYGHNGNSNGCVATAYVFPDDRSAIVALSNAVGAGDAAETASRIMLQALFNLKPRVSSLQPLRDSRDRWLQSHACMIGDWGRGRDISRFTGALKDFVGIYVGLNTVRISILATQSDDSNDELAQLAVQFGDIPASQCALEPYNADMLNFLPLDMETLLSRGMLAWHHYKMGILEFVRDKEDGTVAGFWWKWDSYEHPSLWVREEVGMGPQQIQEVLDKFGQFRT